MKALSLFSSVLALSLAVSMPTALAHVGHGDEFQAEGGINRVEVNAETDPLLGIQITPIEPATDGSGAVFIPVTALVDDNGRQLVFVQYENFYEPVPVTTGATQGELIEITEGLAIGEQLVTQGSLSLYAESRKTQTADTSTNPEVVPTDSFATASPATDAAAHAQADAQGIPHSHDTAGNLVAQAGGETAPQSGRSPLGIFAAVGAGAVLVAGAIVLGGRKKKSVFANKKGGF